MQDRLAPRGPPQCIHAHALRHANAAPTAGLPTLRHSDTVRAFFPGTPIRDIADPQSADGTVARSQGAVFSAYLEPASAALLSEVFVDHEGLEPSTNGLRRGGVGRREAEPRGIAGSSAAPGGGCAAPRRAACLNSVPVFWDAALADRVLAAALAGLADRIARRLSADCRPPTRHASSAYADTPAPTLEARET